MHRSLCSLQKMSRRITTFLVQDVIFLTAALCVTSAAQDVNLMRTEPDPEQLPCPDQTVEFTCEIMVPSASLIWTLPTGDLEFSITRNVGYIRNSSNDIYSANLTNKIEDDDPSTDRFLFSSTLLILQPVNGSHITCSGGTVADPVQKSTTITLSGFPDPPTDLLYSVMKDSVDLQWARPSYTGGVPVVDYTVRANNDIVTVEDVMEDDMERVQYSGLVYGEVNVTAINSCGQGSTPATIHIPASAPPLFSDVSHQFSCEEVSLPWMIHWMYKFREEGVLYPPINISVELTYEGDDGIDPGEMFCSEVTVDDNNCTLDMPRGVYNITLTQTNELGSNTRGLTVDTRPLIVEKEMLDDDTPLSVTVTVNEDCPNDKYIVMVGFGARRKDGGDCDIKGEFIDKPLLSPGESTTFSVEAYSVTRGLNEEYCYIVKLNGTTVIEDGGGSTGLSTLAIGVGVAVGIVLVVVIIILLSFCWKKCWKTNASTGQEGKRKNQLLSGVELIPDGDGRANEQDPTTTKHSQAASAFSVIGKGEKEGKAIELSVTGTSDTERERKKM